MIHARVRLACPIVLIALLSACTTVAPEQQSEIDPWQPLNRSIYRANTVFDNALTKPIATGYQKIIPGFARTGVSNFFRNLTTPRSILNNVLQGKLRQGFSETGRLLFNTTLGIGGLIDVASMGGMEEYREDFGQTAAVWGVPDGPFVVVPILGPQNLRDAVLLPLDIVVDPLFQYEVSSVRDKLYILRVIDLRHRLLTATKFLDDAKDPYATTRESYLQNREYEIYDGDPPLEEDDFFDEFLEED